MSDFQVGDVVVCVDDRMRKMDKPHDDMPSVGNMYRIAEIVVGSDGLNESAVGFRFNGMRHSPHLAYHIDRFRKVPKADEQFTADLRARLNKRVPA